MEYDLIVRDERLQGYCTKYLRIARKVVFVGFVIAIVCAGAIASYNVQTKLLESNNFVPVN